MVSDLHLGAGGPGDAFDRDEALCAFLERLGSDAEVTNLVLLGDTFDLVEEEPASPGVDATTGAVSRLEQVVDAHREVVTGIAALLRAGKNVTVVRGNHDVDLARPRVRERFAELLGGDRWPGRLMFIPWLLHLPGLLLAEHGHQQHDINRFERQLWPFATASSGGPVQEPFGAELARVCHTSSRRWLPVKVAGSVLRHGLRMQSPRRRRRGADYRSAVLPAITDELGLPLLTAAQLDAVSERSALQVLARIATARGGHRRPVNGYLPKGAEAVLRTLGPATPPYLVYGHSHAADAIELGSPGCATTYLNTGTWCRRGPRPGDTTLRAANATWVEVEDGPGHPARVLSWTGAEPQLLAEVIEGRVTRAEAAS